MIVKWCRVAVPSSCTVTPSRLINTRPLEPRPDSNPFAGPQCLLHIARRAHLQCKSTNTIHNLRFNIDALQTELPHSHTKRIKTIDLTLHEGRRKNSLQQWAGVTINTLMISRDRREKASGGGRRNPFHSFQEKSSTRTTPTGNITIWNGTISHEHYYNTNPQHWFGFGTKDVFRNTARRIHSLRETTDAHGSRARTELVLLGTRGRGEGWTGAFGSVLWKYFVSNARVMSASASA